MARPRARTRACSRRSEMNGFSDRAIVLERRRRRPASPDDPILLLFLVLLGLFLLRRTLVVVPDVLVLFRAALDAVGAQAVHVVGRARLAGIVVPEEVVVGVLGDGLQVASFRPGFLQRRVHRTRNEVQELVGIAVLVRLELLDRFDGVVDRLLRLRLLRLAPLVVVPEVGVVAAAPGAAVGAVADDVVVRPGAGAAVEEGPAPGVLDVALVVAVLGIRRGLLRLDLQVFEDQ